MWAATWTRPTWLHESCGAVGDFCATFFRLNGSYTDPAINARGSGPDLSRLAAVPHRLCVVSGLGRVSGTIGALRAGVISDLVIDEPTAAAVLTASAGLRA